MRDYPTSINQRVENIRNNKAEVDKLIQEYKPFIASVVEGAVGRYVRYGEDDELSIALMAFEESIRGFDSSKGNFLSFAKNVIRKRLIDFYRKENRHNKVVPLTDRFTGADEEGDEIDFSQQEAIKIHLENQAAELRRMEIEDLRKELNGWGLTYSDVAKSSPKQVGTRKTYLQVVNYILSMPELLGSMKRKRYLPIAEILKYLKVPRKKIERGRNYIIAAVLILSGDYQYLKDFVEWR